MILKTGDMWSAWDKVDLFLITTNATVTKNQCLVMGRGIAGEARARFPGLDMMLGGEIRYVAGWRYGLLVSSQWPEKKLGCFQVKVDWRDKADMELIGLSAAMLCRWCEKHPKATVALNFPGIGNGRLAREDVLPLLAELPDAVEIWER